MAGGESAVVVLPEDIIDEILVRLPVKSILKFESVCKPWKSKFHSTSFKEFYQQRGTKSETKVAHMKYELLYKIAPALWHGRDYRQDFLPEISTIGPLSNGIYCLISTFSPSSCFKIALCNPGIRHFKFLPPFPPSRFFGKVSHFSPYRRHVGFNRTQNNGYEVVVIIHQEDIFTDNYLVLVYNSNSDEWERLVYYIPGEEKVGPPSATRVFTQRLGQIVTPMEVCSQKLLNGCWHWMVRYDGCFAILAFNFGHQSFSIIKGPPIGDLLRMDVVVLHGYLAVINKSDVSVWMMMDYGVERSWTIKFKVCPHYEGVLSALYRIDYSVLQDRDEEEGGSDDIFIERMVFTRYKYRNTPHTISFERYGGHILSALPYHPKRAVSFSTTEISSYKETLERLY